MPHNFRLLHFTLKKELTSVYESILLRTLALSLISLFIPIYLNKDANFSCSEVLIFYVIVFTFIVVGYHLSNNHICSKFGTSRSILLSVPFNLLFFFLLYNLDKFPIGIYIAPFVYGLSIGLYWSAFHFEFAYRSDSDHRAEEVKFWYAFASIIGIIGPLIGGFLISVAGFGIVFILVLLLLLLSVAPFFKSKSEEDISRKVVMKNCFRAEYFHHAPKYFVQGLRDMSMGIFWPLYMFLVLGEFLKLGAIFAVSALVSAFAIWIVGNRIDKVRKGFFSRVSAFIYGIVSVTKAFAVDFLQILGINIASGISGGIAEVSVNALAYDSANKSQISEYIFFREIIFFASRITIILILLFSGLDMINSLKLSFLIIAGASFLQLFL